jgi:hypothetical protein
VAAGRLDWRDWRIYRLDGTFEDLIRKTDGDYALKCMALAVDWVTE